MRKIVTVAKMREIEAAADAAGVTVDRMMENAGQATARRALAVLSGQADAWVTVLVGPGNNGGDGLVAGRILAAARDDLQVRFYLLGPRDDADPHFKAVRDAGLFVAFAGDDRDFRALRNMVSSAHLVIDALFGIGLKLPLRDEAAKLLRNVRQALNSVPSADADDPVLPAMPEMDLRGRPHVLAVDCPSGLDCDSGEVDKNTMPADETVTFIAGKPGLFLFPGAEITGRLSVASVGVPATLKELDSVSETLADGALIREMLPARPAGSHKGTFGRAMVAGGSVNYIGAPGLAAQAAYRVGAGLVTVGAPHSVVAALASRFLETTWLLLPHDMGVISESAAQVLGKEMGHYQALLLGPGFGREDTTRDFLTTLLERASAARPARRREIGFGAVLVQKAGDDEADATLPGSLPPLVIDADGLNLLSEIADWPALLPPDTILTPHPGEMARLAALEKAVVVAQRWSLAREKAEAWRAVVVLKGAHTVIAAPDGRFTVLPFKTDALATAGTGDVLAGAIVGFLAQRLPAYEAAVAGGYVHGLAGELAAQKLGVNRAVMAGDVAAALPAALRRVESGLRRVNESS